MNISSIIKQFITYFLLIGISSHIITSSLNIQLYKRIDSSLVTLLLMYIVSKYTKISGTKLEGEAHSKIFFIILTIYIIYKLLFIIHPLYNSDLETLYIQIETVSFFKQILPEILSGTVAILMGIWLGNGNLTSIIKPQKTANIYSTSDEIEANKLVELLDKYNIDASINKVNSTSFHIMVTDNLDYSKASEIINSYSN